MIWLFIITAYVLIGTLTMLAIRCWGIYEPMHSHALHGDYECTPGPSSQCPAQYIGKKPLPLAGWVFGAIAWPPVLLLWAFTQVMRGVVRVGSIRF